MRFAIVGLALALTACADEPRPMYGGGYRPMPVFQTYQPPPQQRMQSTNCSIISNIVSCY